jgi:hypothetical protein
VFGSLALPILLVIFAGAAAFVWVGAQDFRIVRTCSLPASDSARP